MHRSSPDSSAELIQMAGRMGGDSPGHRDTESPGVNKINPGRRSSWVKVAWKVPKCVSVSEDPPTPGDTL